MLGLTALQIDVTRRFAHGLSFLGAYTFSKALDDGDSLSQTPPAMRPAWFPIRSISQRTRGGPPTT